MAGKGETVKYIIDADTSGFARGMAEAAIESEIASKAIDRNLTKTSKRSQNNFNDIRKNAQQSASQIRNFGLALQGFNATSLIVGVSALGGAVIELSGALAAAGSTVSILLPALVQGGVAVAAFKTGISGLSAAFKALAANDPRAWAVAMANLGPASQSFARAAGAINNAFKDIKLNVSQALLSGIGNQMLTLGAQILPIVNTGLQLVGRALNGLIKNAIALTSTPAFRGLLSTVFQDTANNVAVLSGALGPLLTIFTQLYAITRPYFALLAQGTVNLLNTVAAYLSSARGQQALNLSIQEGIIAIRELGSFVFAVFGLLTSVFRVSVSSGNSLIGTLTGIIKQTTAWVNSAKGQADLIALFNFTSLAVQNLAHSLAIGLQVFFAIIRALDSLSPSVQKLVLEFLSLSFAVSPISSYFLKLFGSIKLVGVVIFNLFQQLFVVAGILGVVSSVTLLVAGVFIILGAIIHGPLGTALIILGIAMITYIGLAYLAAAASSATGVGMGFAARGALFLQQALLPLLVLAGGVLVILNLLGVMGSSTKKASTATGGFSNSLGSLQKSLAGVGSATTDVSSNGLADLNQSLGQTVNAAQVATGALAGFDKMNVLANTGGITGLPTLPNLGGAGGGALVPPDTSAFNKALDGIQNNFDGLSKDFGKGLSNPFKAIADWLTAHPGLGMIALSLIVVAAMAIIIFATLPVSVTIGLIVLAIAAVIAIVILLAKNWDTVWGFIKKIASDVWQFLQGVWDAILGGVQALASGIGDAFSVAWGLVVAVWNLAVAFFQGVWNGIVAVFSGVGSFFTGMFQVAWDGIVAIWNLAIGFFQGIWSGITGAFSAVGSFFANTFSGAWNAIKTAFGAVGGFFQGIWDNIVSIFGSVGTSIGNAVAGAFKGIVNEAINWITDMINGVIKALNGAINIINKIPKVNISTISTIALPKLAQGGIVTSPTVAQLGENGTEAVMPLQNNTEWIDQLASKINGSNNNSNSSTPDIIPVTNKKEQPTQSITINVSGVFATSTQEQKKVADLIIKQINSSMKAKGLQVGY